MAKQAQPPLFDAAQANDVDGVTAIIDAEGNAGRRDGPFGWSALHVASGYGASEVIQVLLAAGVGVDVRSTDGETPLHIAAQQACESSVRLLVANGADSNATNDDGETPLHTAVQHIGGKDTDCIKALLELGADASLKDGDGHDAHGHAHINTNRADEIEAILRASGASADPSSGTYDVKEIEGSLVPACKSGKVNCVEHLLGMASPSDRSKLVQRTLVSAAQGGHVEVIEFLVAARADVCAPRDQGSELTPLIAAADENHVKIVKWLLAMKADVGGTSPDRANALMAASLRGCDEATGALLAARADINHQAAQGWTALMVACQGGRTTVVKRLLDASAQLDASNSDGNTGKDLAAANHHEDVVKLLDTRAKLNSRRAKASATAADIPKGDDLRDMEALLSALGEPSKTAIVLPVSVQGSAGTGKAKKNKRSTKTTGKAAVAQASTQEITDALSQAKETVEATEELPQEIESSANKAAPVREAVESKAVPCHAQKDDCRSEGKAKLKANVEGAGRCAALKKRLRDIEQARALLDSEELAIRREIMSLEP